MDHQAKLAAHRSPVAQLKKPIYSTTVMGAFDANNICVNDIYTHISLTAIYNPNEIKQLCLYYSFLDAAFILVNVLSFQLSLFFA